ncbi:MAG: tRNA 2-thiouridine(34) synthase MnmA [Gammaproteobacteria bacterium]|nr:tRNA 2-thiouridine(34) synthase MnmA [Gammaproteobacteria bacterium]
MTYQNKQHIVVGLSGGVDSSVAALLLKQQGYKLTGVFMQNWEADREDPYCSAMQDLTDARSVCDKIEIPLKTVNFAEEYWEKVFQNFLDELARGRTPNPDILCNQEIKFKAFLNYAINLGADYIATGHYSKLSTIDNITYLKKAVDTSKDQSYFLHRLNQFQLSHSLFPLGDMKKTEVRNIAKHAGFINSTKKDSTGICFIGERKFKDFLSEYLLAQPGNIETDLGEVIGKHQGLMFYTLGQRQGLGIGGSKNHSEAPWYVLYKDIPRNTLIVGQNQDHPLLLKNALVCSDVVWITKAPSSPFHCTAKIRYRQMDQPCIISALNEQEYHVEFLQYQRAITPGQSIVFYQDELCLGGGIIR